MMRAEYDSEANAIAITLDPDAQHGRLRGDELGRAIVGHDGGRPIEVQLLYPNLGVEEPLRLAAEKYDLDFEALVAAARSALAAPDRSVVLEVGLPL